MARTQRRKSYRLPDHTARELLDRLTERRKSLNAFRAKANERRTPTQRIADSLTEVVGSFPFLVLHVCLFTVWIGANMNLVPWIKPYDPFPYGLLTLMMTLEQSLLTIFIIISQNRSADIGDLRNEIDLQINIVAEEEISKALCMLRLIGEHLEIDEIMNDPEVKVMEAPLDHLAIEKQTRKELDPAKVTQDESNSELKVVTPNQAAPDSRTA